MNFEFLLHKKEIPVIIKTPKEIKVKGENYSDDQTQEYLDIPPPELVDGKIMCPHCVHGTTYSRKSDLNVHMKKVHFLRVKSVNGRPYTGGKKEANRRQREKKKNTQEALEKKKIRETEPLIGRRMINARYYQKVVLRRQEHEALEMATTLKANVYAEYERETKAMNGPGEIKMALKEMWNNYIQKMEPIFKAISVELKTADTYHNRVSVVIFLLGWLHKVFPHFIQEEYNKEDVLRMLVACQKNNLKNGMEIGEPSEEYKKKMEYYFNRIVDGKKNKWLGVTFICCFIYWAFEKDNYNTDAIRTSSFFFLSLLKGRL